jgi:hypothetical protein
MDLHHHTRPLVLRGTLLDARYHSMVLGQLANEGLRGINANQKHFILSTTAVYKGHKYG